MVPSVLTACALATMACCLMLVVVDLASLNKTPVCQEAVLNVMLLLGVMWLGMTVSALAYALNPTIHGKAVAVGLSGGVIVGCYGGLTGVWLSCRP